MNHATTVIVGAGQAGLAMSRELSRRNVDHLVLERGTVANAWRTQRWESLHLLTPNWANDLPGEANPSPDPNGFMSVVELASRFENYAKQISAPVRTETEVLRARIANDKCHLDTNQGPVVCQMLVLATGACARPAIPALACAVPNGVSQATPISYKRPSELPEGGVLVVGASATGVQLAREIQASGRPVTLAVGRHTRLPRTYRSYDIEWWLHAIGILDERHDAVDDLESARRTPSPQLIGGPEPVDLNALQACGVEIVGRLTEIRGGQALFSGGLANVCASADLKMGRLLDSIDAWIGNRGICAKLPPPNRPEPTRIPASPCLQRSLVDGGIRSVLWATGYRPDFSWLDIPVLDRRGRLRHSGGVVEIPGLYVLGLPFLRRRQSHQISGVGPDAAELSADLRARLDRRAGIAA